MADLALAVTFLVFCGASARFAYRKGREILSQYRASIVHQFEEAEILLAEAKSLLAQARQEHADLTVKTQEMLGLAREEVAFILKKNKLDVQESHKDYQKTLAHQSTLMVRQCQKKAAFQMWKALDQNIQGALNVCKAEESVLFMLRRLQSTFKR